MLSHISCNYGIRLLFFPHNHPAAIPTSDDFKAQKLPGTDHVLSQVKGMYTNRLEDRSAPSPIPILPITLEYTPLVLQTQILPTLPGSKLYLRLAFVFIQMAQSSPPAIYDQAGHYMGKRKLVLKILK
jgi:hypothetical protein